MEGRQSNSQAEGRGFKSHRPLQTKPAPCLRSRDSALVGITWAGRPDSVRNPLEA